jgi:hypothetical protein
MSITKSKDMDWRKYLKELAESDRKPSDIECTEFSGYLLRRDAENSSKSVILHDDIIDLVANFLIAESPDTIEDLLRSIKFSVVDHYKKEMTILISDEEKSIKEEKYQRALRTDPRTGIEKDSLVFNKDICR